MNATRHHATAKQRIVCISLPRLATDRIARQRWGKSWVQSHPLYSDEYRYAGQSCKSQQRRNEHSDHRAAKPQRPPLVIGAMIKNALRLAACEKGAEQLGIGVGQSLSDARALVPDLDYVEANPEADHQLLCAVSTWCERYTPLVSLAQGHTGQDHSLFLNMSGCLHLFDSEEALVRDIYTLLTAQGFDVRLCLADHAGAAWAMAHYSVQMGQGKITIIAPDAHKEAIAPLPVRALRIERGLAMAMGQVGLKTIGCIADLPRAPLTARFGRNLLRRLDEALGRVDEALSPQMPVAELMAEKRFGEPIVYEEDIKRTITLLAHNILPLLERRGVGSRQCELKLFRVDGKVETLAVRAGQPLSDPQRIAALFFERLAGLHDAWDAGFGFDVVRLNIVHADRFVQTQHSLDGHQEGEDRFNFLLDRLKARLGSTAVQNFVLCESHIPERSFRFGEDGSCSQDLTQVQEGKVAADFISRPLLLLERPELIHVIARVPDGPPRRFQWRNVTYRVVVAEGPERIGCEWWVDGRGGLSRDYFRLEDEEGYRFWLFRHGLYDRETCQPQWYMHGIFA